MGDEHNKIESRNVGKGEGKFVSVLVKQHVMKT